ncbi:MAG TPA: molecular chaperone GroEL [Clostridiales bacterium]|nr:molecular chaperone GroEL [Lachnospiraceae bacterium]HAQ41297.1 molecular chaperone GroEL [Clostridiales bacterium]
MASYVSPKLREKFETLSIDLKNNILKRNVKLNSIYDLINILEVISKEAKE